jgi:tetratricopeptide (TPR) repeat protein
MLKSTLLAIALMAAIGFCGPLAFAAGGSEAPTPGAAPADPNYAAGKQALAAKNWQGAVDAFTKVVAKDPGNANAHNFLAYSYRKSGNLDMAFKHYNEALRLDPKHRGAHEYIGEAYLMAGNLAKAEEHLKALDRLCTSGCEEYSELKKAVAEYKRNTAAK